MATTSKEVRPEDNTFRREKNLVEYRLWTLRFLAFGSMVTSLILGEYIGKMLWVNPACIVITQIGFLLLMYYSIDGALGQFLSIASSIEYTNEEVPKKIPPPSYALKFAIFFLCCTVLFSIVSFPFVSTELTNTNAVESFEANVKTQMLRDSVNKINAFAELGNQTKIAKEAERDAIKEKQRLINEAVQSGTESWKADYQAAKNNPSHWFWTCKRGRDGCPQKYIDYRNRIIDAGNLGDKLIAESKQVNQQVIGGISSVLSYNVASDTMLLAMKTFTVKKESERETRKGLITYILIFTTFVSGIGSFLWTRAIRDHRDKYGQQVPEPDAFALAKFFAIPKRFAESVYNLLGSVLMLPINALEKNSFLKPLVIEENRLSGGAIYSKITPEALEENETHVLPLPPKPLTKKESVGSVGENVLDIETVKKRIANRKCGICENDISHKRSHAKWCSTPCRMKGNAFNLK